MTDSDNGTKSNRHRKDQRSDWDGRLIGYVKRKLQERKTKKQTESPTDKAARRTADATYWIAAFTIVLAFVAVSTLYEVIEGGKDTHDLAVAAKNQADRMQDFANRMKDQNDRTKDLADRMKDQADRTKTIADEAIIQAHASKSAADTAKDALHVSERAYIVTGAPVLQLDTDVVDLPVTNTGRIPSGRLKIVIHEATIDVPPTAAPGSIIVPTEQHWQHYDILSIPATSNGASFAINTPVQAVDATKIGNGRQQIFLAGSITYNDGFQDSPVQTWMFCVAGLYWEKTKKIGWTPCDPILTIKELTVGDHYPANEYAGQPYTPNPN